MVSRSARRRGRRSRWLAAGAVVVLVAGFGVASAAHLTVTSDNILAESEQPCSTATLSVHVSPTGFSIGFNKTAVQITNFPAACNGQTVQVAVANGAGTQLATGSATCTGSPCTVSTGAYNATQVASAHVLANTWGIPASWDSACTVFFIFMNCS